MKKTLFALVLLALGTPFAVRHGVAEDRVDYAGEVRPLLARKCFACHGALKRRARLRLDAAALIREGGRSGPVVVPGDASASLLIARVTAGDPGDRMPPAEEGEPLTAGEVELLRAWIDQGAAAPAENVPPDPREHWAFRPPERLETAPGENPIDAVLAGRQAESGITPAGLASKPTLLRRVYLDLVGLPPTRDELRAFLDDPDPRAYDKVVDRLLGSPRYAERWARHWMDVWRYSDWAGYGNEIRYSQRHIWRWRDWIVESLDEDKGYDAMILEMLAADELRPDDEDAVRATGFLARNWYKFDRDAWLDQTVEHTFRAFLGMTVNCARCHDHKYDPIAQEEYYRARAIFEPYDVRTDRVRGELDVSKNGVARVYDAKPDAATYFFERGDPKRADESRRLSPGVPASLGSHAFEARAVTLPTESFYPALRASERRDLIEQAQDAVASARDAARQAAPDGLGLAGRKVATAEAQLASLEARWAAESARLDPAHLAAAAGSHDRLAREASALERRAALRDAEEKLLAAEQALARARAALKKDDPMTENTVAAAEKERDDAQKRLVDAEKAAAVDSTEYAPLGPVYPRTSTGRRLALARWIVDPRHPLTARVAVNHIWLRHFGRPLVENVADFGLRSPRPPLADLLDTLAVDFMESGWSMKRLHRLLVTSAAYRRRSEVSEAPSESGAGDRENTTLWRMNCRRIEAEAVRDAILFAGGGLDVERGGPEIDEERAFTVSRRSLYFRHARQRQVPFLEIFDAANPRECYRRRESVRPQQAFALINSPLVLAQSRLVARRLGSEDDPGFVTAAFETVLTRSPREAELLSCLEFLRKQTALLAEPEKLTPFEGTKSTELAVAASEDPVQRARENLILVLFNHNDFVTVR